jgi:hypothetical protein
MPFNPSHRRRLESVRTSETLTRRSTSPQAPSTPWVPFSPCWTPIHRRVPDRAAQEFAILASNGSAVGLPPSTLQFFAKVAASVCSVESEHRVLGRVIGNQNPANQKAYAQTDGLTSLAHGANSAVNALKPFLTPSTGPAYSLRQAIVKQGKVVLPMPIQDVLPSSTVY